MENIQTLSADTRLFAILAKAADLLEVDPGQVEQQAINALQFAPGQPHALQLLVAARRMRGDIAGARDLLGAMAADQPWLAGVHSEYGMLCAETGMHEAAIRALRLVIELEPRHPHAWRMLADALIAAGDGPGAARAYARHAECVMMDLDTLKQVSGLGPDQLPLAEAVLNEFLKAAPSDLLAILLLGRLYVASGRFESAQEAFRRALDIDPAFRSARLEYANVLHRLKKFAGEPRLAEIWKSSDMASAAEEIAPDVPTPCIAALQATLVEIARSLEKDTGAAAVRASEVLDTCPGQPQTLYLLIAALKLAAGGNGAREAITRMENEHPNVASIRYELGLLFAQAGMPDQAIARLARAVEMEPAHPSASRILGNQLARNGEPAGAAHVFARHIRLALQEFKFLLDALAAPGGEAQAEAMLNQSLAFNPTDVVVNRMKGQLLLRCGRVPEAEIVFQQALERAPSCTVTRDWYSMTLMQAMNWQGANAQLEILLKQDPGNRHIKARMAAGYIMMGEHETGMRLFEECRAECVDDKMFWFNYGNAARTVGKDDATIVDAYRRSIGIDPGFGLGWWGLANMKTYRFSADEISSMRGQLPRHDVPFRQRGHLEFALGRALEDEGAYGQSFVHYNNANALARSRSAYSADMAHAEARQAKAFFSAPLFAARKNVGCPSPDPIFIVGMPRAGSTLVEQILSSHSLVEGTMELPDLVNIACELVRAHSGGKSYPELLADLDGTEFRRMGEDYIARTRIHRKLGRPFFTDKSGNNFLRAGLIHLILPNAKIIDMRRHPLACGFSCYKQAFPPGSVLFAYDQTDIGRYYRDYAETMAHFERVLPGRMHSLRYENLVADPEGEIRRLLAYCDLPFEPQCLSFHKTDRSVRTSSSQQVRQPIRKKSVEDWQHYDAWLQPMKDALGEVLTGYAVNPDR